MKPRFHYNPAEAMSHLRARDEVLGEVMDQVGVFAMEPRPIKSLFEALLKSIVYQQLHGKAAESIHGRVLVELKQHGGATPEALLKASDTALRGAGLSTNKLLAARALAVKSIEGVVPTLKEAHKLDDEELVRRLTEVRGIGPWTVHVLQIFYLGRPDVLPEGGFLDWAGFQAALQKAKRSDAGDDHQARTALATLSVGSKLVFMALARFEIRKQRR